MEFSANEFHGFRDVHCCKCNHISTVAVSGWTAEIRDEIIVKFAFNPPVFVCSFCQTANTVCVDMKPEIRAKTEEGDVSSKKAS
jgi:hypothetical protein